MDLGFEKMILKNESLKCFFINKHDSPYFESEVFKGILDFVQTGTNKGRQAVHAGGSTHGRYAGCAPVSLTDAQSDKAGACGLTG